MEKPPLPDHLKQLVDDLIGPEPGSRKSQQLEAELAAYQIVATERSAEAYERAAASTDATTKQLVRATQALVLVTLLLVVATVALIFVE